MVATDPRLQKVKDLISQKTKTFSPTKEDYMDKPLSQVAIEAKTFGPTRKEFTAAYPDIPGMIGPVSRDYISDQIKKGIVPTKQRTPEAMATPLSKFSFPETKELPGSELSMPKAGTKTLGRTTKKELQNLPVQGMEDINAIIAERTRQQDLPSAKKERGIIKNTGILLDRIKDNAAMGFVDAGGGLAETATFLPVFVAETIQNKPLKESNFFKEKLSKISDAVDTFEQYKGTDTASKYANIAGNAIGQMAAMAATFGASKALALPEAISVAGGYALAGQSGKDTYEGMLKKGYSPREAALVAIPETVLLGKMENLAFKGLLENEGAKKVLAKYLSINPGKVSPVATRALQYGEEVAQELSQTLVENATARTFYDENRDLSEGMFESAIGALFGAGFMHGVETTKGNIEIGKAKNKMQSDLISSGYTKADAKQIVSDAFSRSESVLSNFKDSISKNIESLVYKPSQKEQDKASDLLDIPLSEIVAAKENGTLGKLKEGPVFKQEEKDLIAMHNTTEKSLEKSSKTRGLAVPSIAITKSEIPLDKFGEISLIGGENFAKGDTYTSDAYTKRMPTEQYDTNTKNYWAALDKIKQYEKLAGENRTLEGLDLNRGPDELERFATKYTTPRLMYLKEEMGIDIEGDPKSVKERAKTYLINRDEYVQWVKNKFSDIFKEPYFYDSNGKKKSYTEENIMKYMLGRVRGAENYFYGAGSVKAKISKKLTGIEQVRKNKDLLLSEQEAENIKGQLQDELFQLTQEIQDNSKWKDSDSFGITEQIQRDIASVGTNITPQKVKTALIRAGIYNPNSDLVQKTWSFLKKLQSSPVDYFEAKPQRKVYFSEFGGAVLPINTNEKIKEYLRNEGLKLVEYDPNIDGDRQKKIQENFKDIMFKRSTEDMEKGLPTKEERLGILQDFKDRLKIDFDIHIVDKILTDLGEKAEGAFHHGATYIAKYGVKNVEYHEMVHLLFRNIEKIPELKAFDKKELLKEITDTYPKKVAKQITAFPRLSTEEAAEEVLADLFMDYAEARKKGTQAEPKTALEKFFDAVYKALKAIGEMLKGTKEMPGKIQSFYNIIESGKTKRQDVINLKSNSTFSVIQDVNGMSIADFQLLIPQFKIQEDESMTEEQAAEQEYKNELEQTKKMRGIEFLSEDLYYEIDAFTDQDPIKVAKALGYKKFGMSKQDAMNYIEDQDASKFEKAGLKLDQWIPQDVEDKISTDDVYEAMIESFQYKANKQQIELQEAEGKKAAKTLSEKEEKIKQLESDISTRKKRIMTYIKEGVDEKIIKHQQRELIKEVKELARLRISSRREKAKKKYREDKKKKEVIQKFEAEKQKFEKAQKLAEELELTRAEREALSVQIPERIAQVTSMFDGVKGKAIRKKLSGMPMAAANKFQDKTWTQFVEKLQTKINDKTLEWLNSGDKLKNNVAAAAHSIFGELGMTPERLKVSDELKGKMALATSDSNFMVKKLGEKLKESLGPGATNKDLEKSKERIWSVLDPELATEKVSMGDLSEMEQRVVQILRVLSDLISEVNYANGFISKEAYENSKGGKYLMRSYDEYELPPEVNEFIKAGKKLELGMFKKRKDVDEWKKEHAIKDPLYLTAKRLDQTLKNNAILNYTKNVVEKFPEAVSDTEKYGFTQLSDSPAYGELAGKWVSNNFVEDLRGYFFGNAFVQGVYDLFKKYDKLPPRQLMKKVLTVYNPFVQAGNVLTNYPFAFMAGVDPVNQSKNIPAALKQISKNGEFYRDLVEANILMTDFTRADLLKTIEVAEDKPEGFWKKLANLPQEAYGASDDIMKLSAYISLQEQGYSKEEAMKSVREGFQNYATVGKLYDFASKMPVLGNPFIKFQGDLMRIIKNGIKNRPLNTAAFLGFLQLAAMMASKLSGEDEEEREVRENRAFVPKIPFLNIPLVWQTPLGEVNVARYASPYYSYTDPSSSDIGTALARFSPWSPEFVEYTSNPAGITAVDIAKSVKDPIMGPFIQTLVNSDFRGKPILDPAETDYAPSTLTPKEKGANALAFIIRAFAPQTGKDIETLVRTLNGQKDAYGRTLTPKQAIFRLLGIRIQDFEDTQVREEVAKTLEYAEKEYERHTNQIGAIYRSLAKGEISEAVAEKRTAEYLENIANLSKRTQNIATAAQSLDILPPTFQVPDIEKIAEKQKKLEAKSAKKKEKEAEERAKRFGLGETATAEQTGKEDLLKKVKLIKQLKAMRK